MTEISASHSVDLERAELETVLAVLARKPRLATLLRYLAEKAFQGKSDEINEYNIAIEVFGRSKTSFETSKDAIARVEAHRLRKRLKEYYQAEGKEHAIEISLPTGSYVPAFTLRYSTAPDVSAPESLPGTPQLVKPPSALYDESLKPVNLDEVDKGGQESDDLSLSANENGGSEEIVSGQSDSQGSSTERH